MLRLHSQRATPRQLEQLCGVVQDLFRHKLNQRLFRAQSEQMHIALEETDAVIQKLAAQLDRRRTLDNISESISATQTELQEARIESESSRSLQASLATQLELEQARQLAIVREHQASQAQPEAPEAKLSAADRKTITLELEAHRSKLESLQLRLLATNERVSRLAVALDEARTAHDRSSARCTALEARARALHGELEAGSADGSSAALDSRRESLNRQRDRQEQKLSALVPVQVEVWG
jgi:hypothetical protein